MIVLSLALAAVWGLGAFVCWLADLVVEDDPPGNGKRTPADPWEWEWTE